MRETGSGNAKRQEDEARNKDEMKRPKMMRMRTMRMMMITKPTLRAGMTVRRNPATGQARRNIRQPEKKTNNLLTMYFCYALLVLCLK